MIITKKLILILTLLITTSVRSQQTDTLTLYSKAFDSERTIYVSTPEFYTYQSDKVKLPVIYILDGQHEWFVNPLLSTIKYLQYTHQIPQAIIVSIPLLDRNKECTITSLENDELALHRFITKEVDKIIQSYRPNTYKIIIGHSFSASFALYSFLKAPEYYSAVIAHTPMDSFKELISAFESNPETDHTKISVSIGGKSKSQDYYHRKTFDKLQTEFPQFFNTIHTFIADNSGHTAVPIVANPYLLTNIFSSFNDRYSDIAKVDEEYKIITRPSSVQEEMSNIELASKIGDYFYPPEIAEINGIASRYWNSDLNTYAIAVYEMAITYYPMYYDFYLQLYDLLLSTDKIRAKHHLETAKELILSVETNTLEQHELLDEINQERMKNGW